MLLPLRVFAGRRVFLLLTVQHALRMQSNPDIDGLIILFLTGQASPTQREALEAWLKESDHNQWVFDQMKAAWHSRARVQPDQRMRDRREAIWRAGTMSVLDSEPRKRTAPIVSRVAATLLILMVSVWGVVTWMPREREVSPPRIVDVVNERGMKSLHTLADGTEVWLNADTRLRHPEVFSDTLRWVELTGEAFFAVTPDSSRPFVVRAGKTLTHVLGTSFNVEAYADGDYVKVSLLEGRVEVRNEEATKRSELSPGQQLLYAGDEFDVQPFDYASTFGWKDGILIFDGVDFETFRNTLERWYGVNTRVIGTPGRDWQIRARYHNESLENVMRDVAFNKNFSYRIEGNNLILNFNVKAMP